MKINKTEFFNKLDKINLLDYKIDYKRNQNYFIYKGFKYVKNESK